MEKVKKLHISTRSDPGYPEYTVAAVTFGQSGPNIIRLHQEDFAEFIEGLRHGFAEIVIKPT